MEAPPTLEPLRCDPTANHDIVDDMLEMMDKVERAIRADKEPLTVAR